MASDHVLAEQVQLDAACNKLRAELATGAPQNDVVAALQQHIKQVNKEIEMHIVPPGKYHSHVSQILCQYVT